MVELQALERERASHEMTKSEMSESSCGAIAGWLRNAASCRVSGISFNMVKASEIAESMNSELYWRFVQIGLAKIGPRTMLTHEKKGRIGRHAGQSMAINIETAWISFGLIRSSTWAGKASSDHQACSRLQVYQTVSFFEQNWYIGSIESRDSTDMKTISCHQVQARGHTNQSRIPLVTLLKYRQQQTADSDSDNGLFKRQDSHRRSGTRRPFHFQQLSACCVQCAEADVHRSVCANLLFDDLANIGAPLSPQRKVEGCKGYLLGVQAWVYLTDLQYTFI